MGKIKWNRRYWKIMCPTTRRLLAKKNVWTTSKAKANLAVKEANTFLKLSGQTRRVRVVKLAKNRWKLALR